MISQKDCAAMLNWLRECLIEDSDHHYISIHRIQFFTSVQDETVIENFLACLEEMDVLEPAEYLFEWHYALTETFINFLTAKSGFYGEYTSTARMLEEYLNEDFFIEHALVQERGFIGENQSTLMLPDILKWEFVPATEEDELMLKLTKANPYG